MYTSAVKISTSAFQKYLFTDALIQKGTREIAVYNVTEKRTNDPTFWLQNWSQQIERYDYRSYPKTIVFHYSNQFLMIFSNSILESYIKDAKTNMQRMSGESAPTITKFLV